jgi:hypothetical protein
MHLLGRFAAPKALAVAALQRLGGPITCHSAKFLYSGQRDDSRLGRHVRRQWARPGGRRAALAVAAPRDHRALRAKRRVRPNPSPNRSPSPSPSPIPNPIPIPIPIPIPDPDPDQVRGVVRQRCNLTRDAVRPARSNVPCSQLGAHAATHCCRHCCRPEARPLAGGCPLGQRRAP